VRLVLILLCVSTVAAAAPPAPSGAHPRMILDPALRAKWRDAAKSKHGPVVGAIALCDEARTTREHDHAIYQGSEWAKVLQACLVAWAATDSADHRATAIKFFTALIDDLDEIGDGKGGDMAARRDDGFAIRMLGPYTALAYDWLYDAIPPAVRKRAWHRWHAWLTWYEKHGYRARDPGNNYQAGYLLAATTIAIAASGEAGWDESWWRVVADDLWAKDMTKALAPGGILEGGDWGEGWQYGPLSVAEYSLAARIARGAGLAADTRSWLGAVLMHAVHGMAPDDGWFAGGDADIETANVRPGVLVYDAIALGDARDEDKRGALGEMVRLKLSDGDWLLYDALATVASGATPFDRGRISNWYLAKATGNFFWRTNWTDHAIWFAATCQRGLPVDHRHPDAGNFVLSRGRDNAIVDPSPYGTQSTLTSNAPTIPSTMFPAEYWPSQADWGEKVSWSWLSMSGDVLAARCDYADAFQLQERHTDVPSATRDFVLLPGPRDSAALVVIDRADTASPKRDLFLRFRTPGATVGDTSVSVATLAGGTPTVSSPTQKDCFKGQTRGNCDAARFPVVDHKLDVPGPHPSAIHVIGVAAKGSAPPSASLLSGPAFAGVSLTTPRAAAITWPLSASSYSYVGPRDALHVILWPGATATAAPSGTGCKVTVSPGTDTAPTYIKLNASCAITR
jgi:hypothetical protein